MRQQRAHRWQLVERQQHFKRPLADIAGAPATAGELLQPARRQEVNQRVVVEPGQHVDEALGIGGGIGMLGVGQHSQLWQHGGIHRCRSTLHQSAFNAQPEMARFATADTDKGQGAGRFAKQ